MNSKTVKSICHAAKPLVYMNNFPLLLIAPQAAIKESK